MYINVVFSNEIDFYFIKLCLLSQNIEGEPIIINDDNPYMGFDVYDNVEFKNFLLKIIEIPFECLKMINIIKFISPEEKYELIELDVDQHFLMIKAMIDKIK